MSNFRTLDLNLLRVFRTLMETGNTTRAAEALGLTQPAVSAALGRLRAQLDDPLFLRVGNAMVPTARAEALAAPVAEALEGLEAAVFGAAPFDPATAEHTFVLRGADFFSIRLMPVLAARVAREAPGVALTFLDSARGDLFDLLETGKVDLALEQPMETPSWVARRLLFPSPFVVVAAANHPEIAAAGVAPGEPLPLDLFCRLPHAMRSTDGSMTGMADAALARQGRARRVVLALPHFEAILLAVERSPMISVVPRQLVEDPARALNLTVYRAPFEIPVPEMQLYWHSRNDAAPAHRWLLDLVRSETEALWGPVRGAAANGG